MRLLLALCCLLTASAQESLPDPATYKPANDADAVRREREWLNSHDVRLVAWAAYLAGNESRRELIPDLIARLDQHDALWDSAPAATLVLDALVRMQAQVPVERILQVPGFLEMRLILASRAPENTVALQNLLSQTGGIATVPWLAAADLLALHPPPGFTAQILSSLQPSLTVEVVDDQTHRTRAGGGRSCGDSGPVPMNPGWPPIRFFGISTKGDTPLSPGAHPVFFYEAPERGPWPYLTCIPYGQDFEMPRGIAADLAKLPLRDFPLGHEQSVTIRYADATSYAGQLRSILQKVNDDVGQVLSTYLRDGLMTQAEVNAFKLPVRQSDLRASPHAPGLPQVPEFRWLK